jgi:hypothetical protein
LKEEALDRIMWRGGFGRGFGPVVRQINKWMNYWVIIYHRYCMVSGIDIIVKFIIDTVWSQVLISSWNLSSILYGLRYWYHREIYHRYCMISGIDIIVKLPRKEKIWWKNYSLGIITSLTCFG